MSNGNLIKTGRYNGNIVDCTRQGQGKYTYPGDIFQYDGPWYYKTLLSFFFTLSFLLFSLHSLLYFLGLMVKKME